MLPLVQRALESRELREETASMRRQLSTRAEYFNIIGASRPMQTIYETIESVAKSDANSQSNTDTEPNAESGSDARRSN